MKNKLNINQDLYEIILYELIEYVKENYESEEVITYNDLSELSYDLYNQDFYIIGIYRAWEFLLEYRDKAIEAIEGWESELGEGQGLKFGEEEKNVNLVMLWFCKELISLIDYKEEYFKEELLDILEKLK